MLCFCSIANKFRIKWNYKVIEKFVLMFLQVFQIKYSILVIFKIIVGPTDLWILELRFLQHLCI